MLGKGGFSRSIVSQNRHKIAGFYIHIHSVQSPLYFFDFIILIPPDIFVHQTSRLNDSHLVPFCVLPSVYRAPILLNILAHFICKLNRMFLPAVSALSSPAALKCI